MLDRFLILLVVSAIAAVACLAWRAYQRRRLATVARQVVPPQVTQLADGMRPSVLYFTTSECTQCHLQQTPILSQLAKVDIAVHKFDAVEQEALARFYGIMTVPTTVVLDSQLRPVAVNHGVTPLPKLLAQIGRGEELGSIVA